jgi:DNA polymerase elongation subunit (family B)
VKGEKRGAHEARWGRFILEKVVGWLFDVYIQGGKAVVWVKTEKGESLRLTDAYTPFFHIEPKGADAEEEIAYRLSECPDVKTIRIESKITSLQDKRPKRLVRVETYGTKQFKEIIRNLERQPLIAGIYNADFRHVQRYLLTNLKTEPTSRVSVECDGGELVSVEKLDDSANVEPPPFSMLRFSVDHETSEKGRVLRGIRTYFRGEEKTFQGSERSCAELFMDYLEKADADLLACPKCDEVAFPLLKDACLESGIRFRPGRCGDGEQVRLQGSAAGRVILGDVCYGFSPDEWGIAGLIERARFAFLPMGLATRWLSNRSIDSRNCFELLQRGYAIPREEYFEEARDLRELVERDRGGIIITPEAGRLHENVAALDFDSQYPNIIVKNGLSYEGSPCGGGISNGSVEGELFRLIPVVIEPWLKRRLSLKRHKKTLPEGSPARLYCEQRVDALKMILVTQYGIAGCCRNRFGNVVTFEEINMKSREAMVKAKAVAEGKGFRIVYGNVDALFVNSDGAGRRIYERLASEIAGATGLAMSLDKHFKVVAFLPLKRDVVSSAINRYFGLTYEGKIEARGIEMRRTDTPDFIRSFQEELILKVLGCGNDASDVLQEGLRSGVEFTKVALRLVRSGSVPLEQLVIRKRMRKGIEEYASSVAQRSAALQLLHSGREVEVGEEMPFVYVDRCNANPASRIAVPGRFKGRYDKEAYAKMVLDAAVTVFSGIGAKPNFDSCEPTLDAWIGNRPKVN